MTACLLLASMASSYAHTPGDVLIPADLFEQVTSPLLVFDPKSGQILRANDSAIAFYGYGRDLEGMNIQQINMTDLKTSARERQKAEQDNIHYIIALHRLADGGIRTMQVNSWPLYVKGRELRFAIVQDITGRPLETSLRSEPPPSTALDIPTQDNSATTRIINRALMAIVLILTIAIVVFYRRASLQSRTENRLNQQSLLMANLLDSMPDLIFFKDLEGKYIGCNEAFCRFMSMDRKDIVGAIDTDLVNAQTAKMYRRSDLEVIKSGEVSTHEQEVRSKSGVDYLFDTLKAPLRDMDGSIVGIIGISRDVTARRHTEQQIESLAFFDVLTHLPNRTQLLKKLQELASGLRTRGEYGALLFIDLDHFKNINDVFGHATGDELLQVMANRLSRHLRPQDMLARLGGDEFVIVYNGLGDHPGKAMAEADSAIAELIRHIAMPVSLHHRELKVGCSIGSVLFDQQYEDVGELLKQADMAMYQAKERGRNQCVWFEPAMRAKVEHRFAIEAELRRALVQQELQLYLQPQLSLAEDVIGYEVLLRWMSPMRGMVMPGDFIDVAEETGLIIPLGDWVLEESCRLMAAHPGLKLAVNVSALQFLHGNFVQRVETLLRDYGIAQDQLTLEVTESLVIEDFDAVRLIMQRLQMQGVRLSIDDFGTGYSSLAYLKRLPINELKIDRSFIRDLPEDSSDASLVALILTLSQHMNLQVVAEGVETEAQAEFLRRHQCHLFQGYYFGHPRPAESWLAAEPAAHHDA
ncbi:EAL domain-containing protein [Pokkaliibacter sp. CJK22405]|uniref:sensor domain-containing protein n=1 Tax=Pokkaliibacter sp. CJK22405 TaxID=3384615 RepID=UPI003984A3A6